MLLTLLLARFDYATPISRRALILPSAIFDFHAFLLPFLIYDADIAASLRCLFRYFSRHILRRVFSLRYYAIMPHMLMS